MSKKNRSFARPARNFIQPTSGNNQMSVENTSVNSAEQIEAGSDQVDHMASEETETVGNGGETIEEQDTRDDDAGVVEQEAVDEVKPRVLAPEEKLEEVKMLTGVQVDASMKPVFEAAIAPVKTPEPVVVKKAEAVNERAPAPNESLSVVAIRHDLSEYIKAMSPGKQVTVKLGTFHQAKLFNVFLAVINRHNDEDFKASMNIIVEAFRKEAKGAFGLQYVFRFMEHVELSSPRIKLFQRLINMFTVMSEPKSRVSAMKQLNWQETLSGEITNEARNRVLKYFNVG